MRHWEPVAVIGSGGGGGSGINGKGALKVGITDAKLLHGAVLGLVAHLEAVEAEHRFRKCTVKGVVAEGLAVGAVAVAQRPAREQLAEAAGPDSDGRM